MTVRELKEKLDKIPDDLPVIVDNEEADTVMIREYQGEKYVDIFRCIGFAVFNRGEKI